MKKELKDLIESSTGIHLTGTFSRIERILKEAERHRQEKVRALFRQWADIGGYNARMTSWKLEGKGDDAVLRISFDHWKRRGYGRSAVTAVIPAYYLDLAAHRRAVLFIEMHRKAAETAQRDWSRSREERIDKLRRELARAEAEVFTPAGSDPITTEEIEAATESQLRDPARLFTREDYPRGIRRPSTAALLAAAMRDRKGATPMVIIRNRLVEVRISVREAFNIAGRHFEAIGVTDRDSYLARAAELKRELRETRAAMPGLKDAVRARRALGDSANTEANALDALRDLHTRAHDERILMKAWAGMRMSDIRRADERARTRAAAA
ncbi:hypothetical protein [Paracoccus sp. ME4]|uniref:hypothetical protein n=1 Tax=Paracoccus sp. ME4 TaxID=3138066 RepID=UPI00398A5138